MYSRNLPAALSHLSLLRAQEDAILRKQKREARCRKAAAQWQRTFSLGALASVEEGAESADQQRS
mgnify:CR=1 FL=1